MANLLERIKTAIFARREDEDDETDQHDDFDISTISQTLGSKDRYGVFAKGYRGFLSEDPNPLLTGRNAIIEFDKMRTVDVQVAATLLAAELPIRSTEWKVNPGKVKKQDGTMETTPRDQEIADFVKYNLFTNCRTSWDDYIRLSLGQLWAGFAVFEKVYEEKNGKIYLKKLADRPQTTIEKFFDTEDNLVIHQTGNLMIPGWKVLIHTYRKEGDNFAGRSPIRQAYQNWTYKTKLYRLDAIAHERNSLKVPVITTPDTPTPEQQRVAKEIVKNMRSSETAHASLPGKDWNLQLLGDGSSNDGLMKSISHHNREISKSLMAQFIELGADGGGGSYALSEDQSSLFTLGLTSLARSICHVTNEFLIKELVDMNFDMQEGQEYPQIDFDKIGDVDYAKIVDALTKLADKKMITPDNLIEDKVRDMFDMPKAVYGEDGSVENGREVSSPKIDISSLTQTPKDPGKKEIKKDSKKKFSEAEHTGCVMMSISPSSVPKIQIDPEDIVVDETDPDGGSEKYPHVTLLYGLKNDLTTEQLKQKIDFHGEGVEIESMDIFEQDEQDVLIFKIRPSIYIDTTHKILKALEHESTYPDYTPHITIAYLKKGTASKYITDDHNGKTLTATGVTYTSDETSSRVKVFAEDYADHKIFSELRDFFDPIDMARLSSLIK